MNSVLLCGEALDIDVRGFVQKGASLGELVPAVKVVAGGATLVEGC